MPRGSIDATTFSLEPTLASKLSAISEKVHNGEGVAVLRGLQAARFNDEEAVIAFAGISSYVCPKRATDGYANQTLSKLTFGVCRGTCGLINIFKAIFATLPTMRYRSGPKISALQVQSLRLLW